jgi:ribosomal protein S27E
MIRYSHEQRGSAPFGKVKMVECEDCGGEDFTHVFDPFHGTIITCKECDTEWTDVDDAPTFIN